MRWEREWEDPISSLLWPVQTQVHQTHRGRYTQASVDFNQSTAPLVWAKWGLGGGRVVFVPVCPSESDWTHGGWFSFCVEWHIFFPSLSLSVSIKDTKKQEWNCVYSGADGTGGTEGNGFFFFNVDTWLDLILVYWEAPGKWRTWQNSWKHRTKWRWQR